MLRPRCRVSRALVGALGFALVLSSAPPPAGASNGSSKPAAGQVAVKTLKNKMKVIVWPDHDIPNVAIYIWYRVGSRNERPGITGLSHFFEHMMFNGSRKYPSGEFDRIMERNGGASNAYTTEDVTVYQDWFPKSALTLAFQLEADRICCLSIDPKMVESERQVVYSERRTRVDDSNASFLDEQLQAAAYVAHPYHHPVIGWPSDIEGWKVEDLREYFRTYYAPNNATMIVVGDVTPREIFRLAERHLEPIPAQPAPPPVTTREPPQAGERRVIIRRPGQTPLLEMAFHTGAANDREAEARDLLVSILASGESSRLYRRLVDQDQVAVDVSGFLNPEGFDPGLVKFFVTVPPGKKVEPAEAALTEELYRIARSGPTAEELTKAKNTALAGYWRSLKTIDSKAGGLGHYEIYRGDYRKLFTAPDRYSRVSRSQIQEAAKRLFHEKNRTVGVLIPESPEVAR